MKYKPDYSKTWKEKIIEVLSDGKWKTCEDIQIALGVNENNIKRSIASYLTKLVRGGYVVRGNIPASMKKRPSMKYVYKITAKPYKRKSRVIRGEVNVKLDKAVRFGCEVRDLPFWYIALMK